MTTLATITLCMTQASGFGCAADAPEKTVQFAWEMTVKQCQGGGFQMAAAKELGDHQPGWSVKSWTCTPMSDSAVPQPGHNDTL